jgi:hypothetical protein
LVQLWCVWLLGVATEFIHLFLWLWNLLVLPK